MKPPKQTTAEALCFFVEMLLNCTDQIVYVDAWTPRRDRELNGRCPERIILRELVRFVRKAERQRGISRLAAFDVRGFARHAGDTREAWLTRCADALALYARRL